MEWLNVVGLSLDVIGAFVLARGLFLSPQQAVELGVGRWASDDFENNLKLPAVQDRLRQSRNAKRGTVILAAGFGLQIVASWPYWPN
jgi:hypothetical protein